MGMTRITVTRDSCGRRSDTGEVTGAADKPAIDVSHSNTRIPGQSTGSLPVPWLPGGTCLALMWSHAHLFDRVACGWNRRDLHAAARAGPVAELQRRWTAARGRRRRSSRSTIWRRSTMPPQHRPSSCSSDPSITTRARTAEIERARLARRDRAVPAVRVAVPGWRSTPTTCACAPPRSRSTSSRESWKERRDRRSARAGRAQRRAGPAGQRAVGPRADRRPRRRAGSCARHHPLASVHDENVNVRYWAVEGLAYLGTTTSIEPLLEIFHDDPSR